MYIGGTLEKLNDALEKISLLENEPITNKQPDTASIHIEANALRIKTNYPKYGITIYELANHITGKLYVIRIWPQHLKNGYKKRLSYYHNGYR